LRLDENDDEIIVPRELVTDPKPAAGMFGGMSGMMGGGPKGPAASTGDGRLVLVESPGKAPANLVRLMQERYGPSTVLPVDRKPTRKDLGLDQETFAILDANGDGVLDAKELAGFVKRAPDVELLLRLGITKAAGTRVELVALSGKAAPLASKVKLMPSLALLDLGQTRLELRGSDADRPDRLGGLLRQQYIAQFKQADKDGKGYLDAKAAEASPQFRSLFQAMDRAKSGKVYEKELNAYLDQLQELKKRGQAACVTLVLSNQSRGLFDLLDVNRDGRLSVREMRGAVNLLEQLGTKEKGYLTKADMPHSYLLTLRRGGALRGGGDGLSDSRSALVPKDGQEPRRRRIAQGVPRNRRAIPPDRHRWRRADQRRGGGAV
jgi:Ca2+-binding EF-hand superfamily protein